MFSGYLSRAFKALIVASLLVTSLAAFVAQSAHAGIISGVQTFGIQSGTGPGMGTVDVPVILTPNGNNDNQLGGGINDNNIIVPIKLFNNIGYIDILFNVSNSGGSTEYKVFESVDNNTLIPWSSYTMQLGFGTGLAFNNVGGSGDGLDFDFPNFDLFPTSSLFTSVVATEDMLVYSGGIQSTGAGTYQFRIDVPDGITQFTLRQTPVAVPEPGSFCLLGALASLGLLAYRCRS